MKNDDPALPLGFSEARAVFKGPTQNARVLSEGWVADYLYCPNCGSPSLLPTTANTKARDFQCGDCPEAYELKAGRSKLGARVPDGAYRTMVERVSRDPPNLMLMRYAPPAAGVTDLIVIPRQFLRPEMIQARKPLSSAARRAGWEGCNIRLDQVPDAGRIAVVQGGVVTPKFEVLTRWASTRPLQAVAKGARGWLLDVMLVVDRLPEAFTLEAVYGFEAELTARYPENRNVRPKIRQQLQVLRDAGVVEFLGGGRYRRRSPPGAG